MWYCYVNSNVILFTMCTFILNPYNQVLHAYYIFSSEKDILREEITSLEVVREKLRLRVTELEEEVRRVRDELLQQINASQPAEDDEVSMNEI